MAVQLGLNKVLAYRHADLVVAVGIRLAELAVLRLHESIYIHWNALGGNIRSGIVDMACHREGTDILVVDVVGRQRCGADEHRAAVGVELVDSQHRHYLVVRATLLEGYSANDIVAGIVGHAVETQLLGHDGRRQGVHAHLRVVQLEEAVLTGYVEDIFLHVDALVQRPVKYESLFRSAEDALVVGQNLLLREGAVPDADIINEALERFLVYNAGLV